MAYARIITIGNRTVIRSMKMDGKTTDEVNQIACTLESLICEELHILKVEVDYEGCNNSRTLE